ncbi:MAG: SMI1/KNR4 family protein [Myxococcales bacterium]|nr:SMI1/KNR4 family protein [Myxococcales bacterium]
MNTIDSIQGLLDEIEQIDPAFRQQVRGVADDELARLEEAVGSALPEVHRQFLRAMGEDWAIPLTKADFRCARLLEYFQAVPWRPPSGYALIGVDDTGNGEDYFLDQSTDPAQVVLFPKGTNPAEYDEDLQSYYEVESPSLPDFVFCQFFFVRHLRAGPNHIDASKVQDVEGAFAKATAVLERLGLTPHPRSGHGYAYYVTPEVSVAVSQPEGYGLGVELGGPDRGRVEHVYSVLHDHVGFAPGTRRGP